MLRFITNIKVHNYKCGGAPTQQYLVTTSALQANVEQMKDILVVGFGNMYDDLILNCRNVFKRLNCACCDRVIIRVVIFNKYMVP